jgi:hypothetical protein
MARKTSIYLTDEMQQRVEASGVSVLELVRRGLSGGEAEPLETVVARALRSALDDYCGGHRVALPVAADLQDGTGVPPEPAEPPAAPVAVPEGKSAPMERRSPEPRTDPEPPSERKRRAPARRPARTSPERVQELRNRALASGVQPIADPAEPGVASVRAHQAEIAAQSGLAAAHALAEQIGAPLTVASELALPVPFVPPPAMPACKHPSAMVIDNICGVCGEEVD